MFRRSRLFALGNLAALLNYSAMFGVIALTAVLLEITGGLTPTRAGLVMLAQPVVMVALSPVAGRLSDRSARGRWRAAACCWPAGLTLAPTPAELPLWIMGGLAVTGLGMAAFSSPNTSAVMGSAERDRLGVAAAILAMMRTLGQSALAGRARHARGRPARRRRAPGALRRHRAVGDAAAYLDGYRLAMAVGALIALVGAGLSLSRGPVVVPPPPAAITR